MKTLSLGFFALMVVTSLSVTAAAAPRNYEYTGWKTSQHFEIANIDGYNEVYNPEEQIVFYVEGRSPDRIDPEPKSGFNVQASITNENNVRLVGGNGEYNEEKRAWLVTFTAPKASGSDYHMTISFYCAAENSPCEEVYGRASTVFKTLPLVIR